MSHEHVLEGAVAEGREELTAEAHAYVAAQARQHFDLSRKGSVRTAEDGLFQRTTPTWCTWSF